ncbi:hypothetical protein JCM39068_11280 [Desulfocastanea catecholica]
MLWMLQRNLNKDMKDVEILAAKSAEEALKVNDGFQGTVDGVDLIDIVKFNALSRATAALKVTSGEQEGMIFFKDGAVVHAMYRQQIGEDAFFTILGFNGGSLQNIRGMQPPIVSIRKSIDALLFEAAVQNDENSALQSILMDNARSAADPVAQCSDNEQPQPTQSAREADKNLSVLLENIPEMLTKKYAMTEIQTILAEFTNIEGVHTACLVGRDGFLLDSLARAGIDAEMVAAIASSGLGSAEFLGRQLGQGYLRMTMFEFENGPVMFAPVGENAFLVIVADQETNLGWIRISIKKYSTKIQELASL